VIAKRGALEQLEFLKNKPDACLLIDGESLQVLNPTYLSDLDPAYPLRERICRYSHQSPGSHRLSLFTNPESRNRKSY
jgi:hypothetical protein